jgi:hypothetical protein
MDVRDVITRNQIRRGSDTQIGQGLDELRAEAQAA